MIFSLLKVSTCHADKPYEWQINFQEAASPIMVELHSFHNFLLVVITAIVVFVSALLIYVVCIMPIGLSLYGSSVSSTIVGILYYIIPFLIVFKFVNKQQKTNVIKL